MDREHRGDLDLEVKIKELELLCNEQKKTITRILEQKQSDDKIKERHNLQEARMYQDHITRIEAINESHKKINGQLRTRISRLETEVKELRQKVEDDKELIQSLYDYP